MATVTRPASRRAVLKFVLSAAAGSSAAAGVLASPGASAAGPRLVDFAERLVTPEQIQAAGYDGALVYVSELRPGAIFDFKPVTRGYADGLRALGLHVVSCYQFGKPGWPTPSDFTRGYQGVSPTPRPRLRCMPGQAARIRRRFSSASTRTSTPRPGMVRLCNGSPASIPYWAWQTKAWSGGAREPAAVLFQAEVVTATDPGAVIDGVHVDVDDVLAPDFGQWDR